MFEKKWIQDKFLEEKAELPVSFIYGEKKSKELLKTWEHSVSSKKLDDERIYYVITYRDPETDFAPLEDILSLCSHKRLSCVGGRSSNGGDLVRKDGSFPFFNLAFDNAGIIFAIGWSGQWSAEFKRNSAKGLNIVAGMEHTHLKLFPGEKIRTIRILMFLWNGERINAHNDFRKFILKYHTPLKDGKPVNCPIAATGWFLYNEGGDVTEQNQKEYVNKLVEKGIETEYFWIDAGWYENTNRDYWALNVGNWFPKKKAFPNGGSKCQVLKFLFIASIKTS